MPMRTYKDYIREANAAAVTAAAANTVADNALAIYVAAARDAADAAIDAADAAEAAEAAAIAAAAAAAR